MNYSGADVGFWFVGGYDLLGYTFKIDVNTDEDTVDITCLGDHVEENASLGVRRFDVSMEAFYNDNAGATDDALEARFSDHVVACLGLEGNTNGLNFLAFEGPCIYKMSKNVSMKDLIKMKIDFLGSGAAERGKVLQPHAIISSTTAEPVGTTYNSLAGSAAGGAGYIQCTNFAGAASLTVKIRHSTDDITYVDLVTFTDITASFASERVTVAGTVNQYLREKYTFNTPTAQTATVFVGFVRN